MLTNENLMLQFGSLIWNNEKIKIPKISKIKREITEQIINIQL